ncbi:hypothetical protein ACLOJK_005228 [Asimina triloba]
MGKRAQRAEALQESVEKVIAELLADRGTARLEQDKTIVDVKATITSKRTLERALAKSHAKVASLQLTKQEAKASANRLSEQGEHLYNEATQARKRVEGLSAELKITRVDVALLCGHATNFGEREAELLAELEASRRG